jgi:hypothetical protein
MGRGRSGRATRCCVGLESEFEDEVVGDVEQELGGGVMATGTASGMLSTLERSSWMADMASALRLCTRRIGRPIGPLAALVIFWEMATRSLHGRRHCCTERGHSSDGLGWLGFYMYLESQKPRSPKWGTRFEMVCPFK